MQGEVACGAGEAAGDREEPSAQGLGGHDPFAQTDAGRPAGQVVRHHLYGHPGGVGGETARGEVVQPNAVLEVSNGILDLGVAAMVGFQFQGLPVPVGDEAVIAVAGEQRQLGAGRGPDPSDDEPYRRGVRLTPEGGVGGLGHIGGAGHPVRNRRPVRLWYGLYEIAQTPVLADGDGEADIVVAADGDDVVGVEAAVGPHGELSCGPGAAYPAQRLTQEVCGAPGGVGLPRSQPGHQHVSGSCGNGQQRMIAPLAGVVVAAGSLLVQSVGLAGRGVQVDGQRPVGRSDAGGPGTHQQFPAHPVQLAHMSPAETAQEGPQGGWSLERASQYPPGAATTQRVRVVYAVAPGQRRSHQGHKLVSRIRPTRGISQVKVTVNEFTQSQALGQGGRKDQSGIGYQAGIVEGHVDVIGTLR